MAFVAVLVDSEGGGGSFHKGNIRHGIFTYFITCQSTLYGVAHQVQRKNNTSLQYT